MANNKQTKAYNLVKNKVGGNSPKTFTNRLKAFGSATKSMHKKGQMHMTKNPEIRGYMKSKAK